MATIVPQPSPSAGPVTSEAASAASARTVAIPHLAAPPRLDDYLSASSMKVGAVVRDFRQREPGDGIPSSQPTTAYLAYDDENFYAVFLCQDEPGQVRGRMSKREDMEGDDTVTVYLDTFHDHQRAYYFTVNPVGIQADGVFTAQTGADARFDTLWYSDARITQDGYAALIAIPFKSLRFSASDVQTWGIALGRAITRNNERSFWPYITRRQNTFLQQLAEAAGLREISPGRNVQLIPYGAFTNATLSDGLRPGYTSESDKRAGIDAKLVLKDSFTFDLTAKPDFSQVESNDPQVTVNKRFEVFFPEKRPFFLDNANFFETPMRLLFTRRLVDPQYGARLTGKVGRWNIGFLGTDDRAPGLLVSPSNPLAGRRSLNGALRVQREFRADSMFGVLATDREFGDNVNRVYSADLRLRLTPNWLFKGQAAKSIDRTVSPNGAVTARNGNAFFADLTWANRNWTYNAGYQDFGAGFRTPLGFVPRVDIRNGSQYLGYLFWPNQGKVLSFGPSWSGGVTWDHAGRIQNKYSSAEFRMDFSGPAGFTLARYDNYEFFGRSGFQYATTGASFYGTITKRFTFNGSAFVGEGVNYVTPSGVDPFVGTTQTYSAGFTWRPSGRLRVDQTYFYTQLGGPLGTALARVTAYNNHLSRTKVNYQFTKALSLRTIVDYNFLSANRALLDSDRLKQFTGDILFTYLLNPGTALYLGYNNRYENLALDPEAPGYLKRYGFPDYMTGRQIYMKLSYLWRF